MVPYDYMKKELSRILGVTLVALFPLAGCVGKKNAEPTATPTPSACVGSTAGEDWEVAPGTRSVIPLPDRPSTEGYAGATDRQIVVLCDQYGNTIYEGLSEQLLLSPPTPIPTRTVPPVARTPVPKSQEATPTSTDTPTSLPSRLDTPIDYLPPDCATLAQGGWVDYTNDMAGGCQDSTYYRVCGPTEDRRCMYDLAGFDNAAVRRVIPVGEGTKVQCDDGTTLSNVDDGSAWDACMDIYQRESGKPPSPDLPLGSQTVVGCIYPGMRAEMDAKGFVPGKVAIHIQRHASLSEYGLGGGEGILCELAPQQ